MEKTKKRTQWTWKQLQKGIRIGIRIGLSGHRDVAEPSEPSKANKRYKITEITNPHTAAATWNQSETSL